MSGPGTEDRVAEVEPRLAPTQTFRFRLFVAGLTPRSVQAITNARALLNRCFGSNFDLEVADVTQRPQWVREAEIVALPTLVQVEPPPARRFIGDLSQGARVLRALGLEERGSL